MEAAVPCRSNRFFVVFSMRRTTSRTEKLISVGDRIEHNPDVVAVCGGVQYSIEVMQKILRSYIVGI